MLQREEIRNKPSRPLRRWVHKAEVSMIDELFVRLEALSKEGASIVVKLDGERWNNSPALPFTVLILGGVYAQTNPLKEIPTIYQKR